MRKTVREWSSGNTWAVKYRPTLFKHIVGQDDAVARIKTWLEKRQLPNTILITGPTGVGKTTLASILACMVNEVKNIEESPDIHEVNIGKEGGINEVREMVESMKYMPKGNMRIYILDEAHAFTAQSKNALLKELEDTPGHVCVILCTDQPDKLPAQLYGRCQKITLAPNKPEHVVSILKRVAKSEKFKIDDKRLTAIAVAAALQPRESIQMLQEIAESGSDLNTAYRKVIKQAKSLEISCVDMLTSIYTRDKKGLVQAIYNCNEQTSSLIFRAGLAISDIVKTYAGVEVYKSRVGTSLSNNIKKAKVKVSLAHTVKLLGEFSKLRREISSGIDNDLLVSRLMEHIAHGD